MKIQPPKETRREGFFGLIESASRPQTGWRSQPGPALVTAVFLVVSATLCVPAAQAAAIIPIEAFAADDAIDRPMLSSDGTQVIYLTSAGRERAIADFHLDSGKGEVLCMVDSHTDGLALKGDRVLFTYQVNYVRYLRSVTPGSKSLNKFTGFGDRRTIHSVFDWLPADPDHILVRGTASMPARIGKMDLTTGDIVDNEPTENITFVGPYIPDTNGNLRLRCIQLREGIDLQSRESDQDTFKTVHTWAWDDPSVFFEGFGSKPEVAYLLTHTDNDTGEIRAFDPRTNAIGPVVAAFPGMDTQGVIYSRDHSRILGVKIQTRESTEDRWLDEKFKHMQAAVDASLPGRTNTLFGWSSDERTFLIRSATGTSPGEFLAFVPSRGTLVRLGRIKPALNPDLFSAPRTVDIPARDGFVIHAVLTTPKASPNGPWPILIIPLDNPFNERTREQFDPDTQFLASRGYATLEVDYRGSWGYGLKYERAGLHELVGKVLDDIEDATRWAVKSGNAREGRVGIMGDGLGATLALIAATHDPDMYQCVVNYSGDPDLNSEEFGNYDWLTRKRFEIYIGHDPKAFASASALDSIGKLKAPILNYYFEPNRNQNWGKLEAKLRQQGKPYVLYKELDPYSRPMPADLRANDYQQLEAFLGANLPSG
jgi:dienelactone hydrolase